MASAILLLAGTKKGLFLFTSPDRGRWELHGPFLPGKEVNHAVLDPAAGSIYATANDPFFGNQVVRSADRGLTWSAPATGPAFSADSQLAVERLWHIAVQNGTLWLGVAPAGLFRSGDRGESWEEITSLTAHPTRPQWNPGAGGMCLHSIAPDPGNPQRLFVGISAAGVFRTDDGGRSWTPLNKNVRAEFLPAKYPEVGQCVHKLRVAAGDSNRLFQQNHCGMYRSDDAGATWTEITPGLPSDFGFPCVVHPRESQTVYVVPLQGAEFRCPPEGKLRVFRSRDGGARWEALVRGLPQQDAYCGMYREAMTTDAADPAGIYLGTNTGKIYASADDGDSWRLLADNLPPVYSLSAHPG